MNKESFTKKPIVNGVSLIRRRHSPGWGRERLDIEIETPSGKRYCLGFKPNCSGEVSEVNIWDDPEAPEKFGVERWEVGWPVSEIDVTNELRDAGITLKDILQQVLDSEILED